MNAITKIQADMKLSELELMILEESSQEKNAFNLIPTRIKISPGGINQFATSDGEAMKEVVAIVAVSQKARGYWAGKGKENTSPLCSSADGVHGNFALLPTKQQLEAATRHKAVHPAIRLYDEQGEFPEYFDCAQCPLNDWGSADEGRGKACKEMRRLVLFVDGWISPSLMTLPPTSVKAWDVFCSALQNKRSAYFAARVRLSLSQKDSESGDTYSFLTVQKASDLTTDEVRSVMELRRQYADYVRSLPIDTSDYETEESVRTVDPETGEIKEDALPPF